MNGHRLRVWVGRDGIRFVSCFYASIVVSGVSYATIRLRRYRSTSFKINFSLFSPPSDAVQYDLLTESLNELQINKYSPTRL